MMMMDMLGYVCLRCGACLLAWAGQGSLWTHQGMVCSLCRGVGVARPKGKLGILGWRLVVMDMVCLLR